MTTYVLVHGAWHGGWCWVRVAERLRRAGHRVTTPTMTGLADRAHLLGPHVDLDMHIEDICRHLECEALQDIVLVGHSYGGMVITGVADRMAGRIRALVYLDAMRPVDGDTVLSQRFPGNEATFHEMARREGEGWWLPFRSPAGFGVTDPDDQAWVLSRLTRQPLLTFTQPIRLTGAYEAVRNRMFVLAGRNDHTVYEELAERLRGEADWRIEMLPTGHNVMVTMPAELSALLLDLA